MQRRDFPKDFLWGAATASFQVEGSPDGDGRGRCIWDTFCATPGKVLNGDTGKVACDHYHRYADDAALMAELGIQTYRMSISWPRVLPEGAGRVNQKGIDFYQRIFDELAKRNIEPSVTLNHWDLPQALYDKGGWVSRDTAGRFRDYAALMFDTFGDRVKKWVTHNEPWVVAFVGNLQGRHAPGNRDLAIAVSVSYHLVLSHALGVEAFRSSRAAKDGNIGIVLNLYPTYAASESIADRHAANIADMYQNRWFLDPVFKGEYPEELRTAFAQAGAVIPEQPGDLAYIKKQPIDFLGVNYYSRHFVHGATDAELAEGMTPHSALPFVSTPPVGAPVTGIGWELYPRGLTDILTRIKTDYGNPAVYITENGCAYPDDKVSTGGDYAIDDEDRRAYLEAHFSAALDAIRAGVNLKGYYVWSLMDNFEWALGYSVRFGIFHVDYETQKRSWKKSARWYQSFLKDTQ